MLVKGFSGLSRYDSLHCRNARFKCSFNMVFKRSPPISVCVFGCLVIVFHFGFQTLHGLPFCAPGTGIPLRLFPAYLGQPRGLPADQSTVKLTTIFKLQTHHKPNKCPALLPEKDSSSFPFITLLNFHYCHLLKNETTDRKIQLTIFGPIPLKSFFITNLISFFNYCTVIFRQKIRRRSRRTFKNNFKYIPLNIFKISYSIDILIC